MAPVAIESLYQLAYDEDNKKISPLLIKVGQTSSFNLCLPLQSVATGNGRQEKDVKARGVASP